MLPQLNRLNSRQLKSQAQLSSGQRYTKLSEDPSAAARTDAAQSEKRSLAQFRVNAENALTLSKMSFGGLEHFKKLSDRVLDTPNPSDKLTNAQDIAEYVNNLNMILEDALSVANSKHQDDYLYGGEKTDAPPFEVTRNADGDITSVTYTGTAEGRQYSVSQGVRVSPFTDVSVNAELAEFMNGAIALRDAQEAGDDAGLRTAYDRLQTTEDNLVTGMSDLSNRQYRMETLKDRDAARFNALEDQISRDNDIDTTQTVVELMQTQTVYQGALQSAGKILNLSILSYI